MYKIYMKKTAKCFWETQSRQVDLKKIKDLHSWLRTKYHEADSSSHMNV